MTVVDPITARRRHDVPGLPDRPISVEEYHARIADGTLVEGSPYELLEGWVTAKMGHGLLHGTIVELVMAVVGSRLPAGWRVRGQLPITTLTSEPEPDLAVVRGSIRDQLVLGRHPGPAETTLAVEVSDSSLADDRGRKQRIYAAAGVRTYWIVNLVAGQIEVYTEPRPAAGGREARYENRRDYRPGESVPLVIDGTRVAEIPVAELLP